MFFFQAEDGIRDTSVTGVQTCALPISADRTAKGFRGPADDRFLHGAPQPRLRPEMMLDEPGRYPRSLGHVADRCPRDAVLREEPERGLADARRRSEIGVGGCHTAVLEAIRSYCRRSEKNQIAEQRGG